MSNQIKFKSMEELRSYYLSSPQEIELKEYLFSRYKERLWLSYYEKGLKKIGLVYITESNHGYLTKFIPMNFGFLDTDCPFHFMDGINEELRDLEWEREVRRGVDIARFRRPTKISEGETEEAY